MTIATQALALLLLQGPSIHERMVEGLERLRAGDRERARALFESVVEEAPGHGPARLQLGELSIESGNFEAARRHLELAVKGEPVRLPFAWYLLARARRKTGDRTGAREALAASLELAPDFVPAHVERAAEAEESGDAFTALEHYRRASSLAPHRADLHAAIANTARRAGALDLARCEAAGARELDPDNAALSFLLAAVEQRAGNVAEAVRWAERARDDGMTDAALFVTLGNLYHEQMRMEDSIAAFETALDVDPGAAESLASFALSSLAASSETRLRRLLEAHVEAHPDSRNTLYGLGAVYLREEELDLALAIFERLGELEPEASQVAYNLALVHVRRGDGEKARAAMARFRGLRAREEREWERQNGLAIARRRIADALAQDAPRIAVEEGEHLPETDRTPEDRLMLAEAHARLSEWASAARLLDAVLAVDGYDAEALEARLRVARELGESTGELERRLRLLSPSCEAEP